MENVAVSVILPKGLKLRDGRMLYEDATFTFISGLTPFFCSVDQVRLEGGAFLAKVPDLTIAAMIYKYSKEISLLSYNLPARPAAGDEESAMARRWKLWSLARQTWVTAMASRELIQNVQELAGTKASKTLGNFAVQNFPAGTDSQADRVLASPHPATLLNAGPAEDVFRLKL